MTVIITQTLYFIESLLAALSKRGTQSVPTPTPAGRTLTLTHSHIGEGGEVPCPRTQWHDKFGTVMIAAVKSF